MTNPYSSGGGGTHFEARVVASTFVAILCEAPVRGLLGDYATEVRTQRADFHEPLDDLIITGIGNAGDRTKLHLQIKNKLAFTENDGEWAEVLRRAWDTFSAEGFDPVVERYGVGIGTYHARVEYHYQAVINWAAQSVDGDYFIERIQKRDFSHKDKRTFVETIEVLLAAYVGRALTNDEIWRFLKSFIIIYFDFQSGVVSRDAAHVVDRLRGFLSPTNQDQSDRIWDHLIAKSGELIPTGGGASRVTLIQHLSEKGLPSGSAPSFGRDLQAITRESERALADIKSTIAGLKIHRAEAYRQIREALEQGRFIQIVGEPGTGKSALLKTVAQETIQNGPVFVLKDGRIHPRGWSAHAHTLRVSDDIATLLGEFACSSIPILFIDGIDKIVDPAIQLTVNDILRALAGHDHLSDWRVLATVREQNLKHIETWLDQVVLKKLPLRTITVEALNQEELTVVAAEVPRLRPLLAQPGSLDVVLSRPFFLDAITGLAGDSSSHQLPATEVELLKLWWALGGSDRSDFSAAQHRRNVLLDLAQRLAQTPNAAIAIRNLAPDSLDELKTAGILRDKELGHSVEFTHDIYEEWALCELLIGEQDRVAAYLHDVGQPQVLVRPTQLLGAYVLETTGSTETWKTLLEKTGESSLRPVWQRAILTSCFQSTRTAELLSKLSADLMQEDGELLRRLLLAISTLEVTPNPLFLNEQLVPDLEADERARLANHAALPKPLIWVRFLDWLVPQIGNLQPKLIPNLLPVLTTWQNNYTGQRVRHCRDIGVLSHSWLLEIEDTIHAASWNDRKHPFGPDIRYHDEQKVEKELRSLFLLSAGDVPDLVASYLREKASDKRNRQHFRENIVKNCGALVRYLPNELVDFILNAFVERPQDHRDRWGSYSNHLMDKLGIGGHHQFYPASPIQPPFLALLRQNEGQGLRLIHGLCNHSISIWRWSCSRRSYRQPVTPLPIQVNFPWGRQLFWGDNQVYLWFRGYGGNDVVKSALMALEQWAIERVEGGAEFVDIFQKVIQGNNSVAALGIGVSLCLAFPAKAIASSVPLVTCPHLWEWDIRRLGQDSSGLPANEIGNWYQYRVQLAAVRKLNQKAHRKQDIRWVTPNLFLSSDKALRRAYLRGIRSFPKRLPFVYKEEKKFPEHVTALREKMKLFAEQGDPKHLKTKCTDDGKHIQLWIEPPSLKQPKYQAQEKEHERLSQYSRLALWASKSLEDGKLDEYLTVEGAISKGKEFDDESVFDLRLGPDNFLKNQQAAAVSGAAFAAARFCSDAAWSDEIGAWCMHVLERAATAPEQADGISYRGSLLTMHPVVFAAHGYSALLARGYKKEHCKDAILNLAVDALEGVVAAVFASIKYYASTEPKFCWVLLDTGLRQCIVPRDAIPNYNSRIGIVRRPLLS